MTAWAVEFRQCLQPVVTEVIEDMRACAVLGDSQSLSGGAWTDGAYWRDDDELVGWTDWPPAIVPT